MLALASAPLIVQSTSMVAPTHVDVARGIAAPAPTSAPPATDSVIWDTEGRTKGDEDRLGPAGEQTTEFTTNGYTWDRTDLTYGFDNWTADLTIQQQADAVASALSTWASVTPLTFTAVPTCGLSFNHPSCTTPDIRIRFGAGDHGSGSSDPDFDGTGGVVAHAYGPVPDAWQYTAGGDIHLDDAETWRVDGSGVDLESVILHESGHALGLGHTDRSCAGSAGSSRPIMCSVLVGPQHVLASDDINGIQSLYGNSTPDLPNRLSVEILEPGQGGGGETANAHRIEIVNGHDNNLSGASLKVSGVSGCDRPTLSLPANSITHSTCTIDPDRYLKALDTSEAVTLTASVTAAGVAGASDGPVQVDVVADDHPFTDVPDWVDRAVDWISYWGLADGFANRTYRPDNSITRAEVTRMLWRYAGEPAPGGTHPFSDVPRWVEDAVTWAAFDPAGSAEPLMAGFRNGTFRPNDPISRAEVVRLLYRYVGAPSVTTLPPHGFSDVPAWVEPAVRWAAHDPDGSGPLEPVVGGFTNGTFRPNDDITRAQWTRSLFRLTDQLVN